MSKLTIFAKGNFQPIQKNFMIQGVLALQSLSNFQTEFEMYDTDTTINSIRDTIIANYLGYDLVNTDKHGFDAKKSKSDKFLEVKQCSIVSKQWGGTWNDTNEEKALVFSDTRVMIAVAVWRGAAELQFLVYGQNSLVGEYLYDKVVNRKSGSRLTQSISISTMIKKWGFSVIVPPERKSEQVIQQIISNQPSLSQYVNADTVKFLSDF